MHLEFVPDDALTSGGIELGDFLPIQFRDEMGHGLAFTAGLKTQQTRYRLVEVKDPSMLINHEHAIFDGVEEGLQERALARQALHDVL